MFSSKSRRKFPKTFIIELHCHNTASNQFSTFDARRKFPTEIRKFQMFSNSVKKFIAVLDCSLSQLDNFLLISSDRPDSVERGPGESLPSSSSEVHIFFFNSRRGVVGQPGVRGRIS